MAAERLHHLADQFPKTLSVVPRLRHDFESLFWVVLWYIIATMGGSRSVYSKIIFAPKYCLYYTVGRSPAKAALMVSRVIRPLRVSRSIGCVEV
jgi:hypothetical protein